MATSRFPIDEDFLSALGQYSASGKTITSVDSNVCAVILDYINKNKNHPQRLNQTNHLGSHTLFSAAIQNGDLTLFEMLIAIPDIVNSPGYQGLTPLMWAILHGNQRMVHALLNSPFINVDAHVVNKDGESVSALSYAIKTANPLMVELLMEKNVSFDSEELCKEIEKQLYQLTQQEVALVNKAHKVPDLIFRQQIKNNFKKLLSKNLSIEESNQLINYYTLIVMIRDKIDFLKASYLSADLFAAQIEKLRLTNPQTTQYFRFYQNQMDGKSNVASYQLGDVLDSSRNKLEKQQFIQKIEKEVDEYEDKVLNEDNEVVVKPNITLSPYDPFVERPEIPIRNRSNSLECFLMPTIFGFDTFMLNYAVEQRRQADEASAKKMIAPILLEKDDESWAKAPPSLPSPLDLSHLPSYRSEMSLGSLSPTTPSLLPAYSSPIAGGFTSFGFVSFGMPDNSSSKEVVTITDERMSLSSPLNAKGSVSSHRLFKQETKFNASDLPAIPEKSDIKNNPRK